jgi:hypothetical protein
MRLYAAAAQCTAYSLYRGAPRFLDPPQLNTAGSKDHISQLTFHHKIMPAQAAQFYRGACCVQGKGLIMIPHGGSVDRITAQQHEGMSPAVLNPT